MEVATQTAEIKSANNATVKNEKKPSPASSSTAPPASPNAVAAASLTATSTTSTSSTSSTFAKDKEISEKNGNSSHSSSFVQSKPERNMTNRKEEKREARSGHKDQSGSIEKHIRNHNQHHQPQHLQQHQETKQENEHQDIRLQQQDCKEFGNERELRTTLADATLRTFQLATHMRENAEKACRDANQTILHLQESLDLAKQHKERIDNELANAIRNEEKAKQYYDEQQFAKQSENSHDDEYPKNKHSTKDHHRNKNGDYFLRSHNNRVDANDHHELNSKILRELTVHIDSTSDDTVSEFSVSTLQNADSLSMSPSVPLPLLRTFRGHECMVLTVAVLHDDQSFVSGSVDGAIKQWSAAKGKCLRTFPKEHTGAVTCVHSMGDRHYFLSGSDDESVKLWNYSSGECEQTFVGHQDAVWSVVQSGTHQFISGSGDATIKLWDILDNNSSNSSSNKMWDMLDTYSNNNNSNSNRGNSRRRQSSTNNKNKCIRTFVGHQGSVFTLAIVGQGRFISGSSDRTIKYWSLSQPSCLRTFDGHKGNLQAVLRLDRNKFISSAEDNTIKVWSISTGDCVATHSCTQNTHDEKEDGNTALSVAFIAKDRFVSGCTNGTIELWNLSKGKCMDSFALHKKDVCSIAEIGNGYFISASMDNTIKLWSLDADDNKSI